MQTFHCPACAAPLDYPAAGTLHMRCPFCSNTITLSQELTTTAPPSSAEIKAILKLAREEDVPLAVSRYRWLFGLQIEDAFEDVDRLLRGQTVSIAGWQITADGEVQEIPAPAPRPGEPHWEPDDISKLARLAREGQKADAILLLRRMFPIRMKEARDLVHILSDGESVMINDITIHPDGQYNNQAGSQ